ncbi:MAG: hypothetical protein DRJ10_12325 [Bacteroidetes bacterium]|nr:MAG: hypothetical protein DRJ10_12325 [Bacteroidota bacterium]
MYTITLQTEKINDILLLRMLAEKIGVKIASHDDSENETFSIEHYLQIIMNGGDMTYVENPEEWQRSQRQDRVF